MIGKHTMTVSTEKDGLRADKNVYMLPDTLIPYSYQQLLTIAKATKSDCKKTKNEDFPCRFFN